MIVGTGIDIEKISRVAQLVDAHAARLDRIFTLRERAFCDVASKRLRLARYAGAFAAKEAVMKALGSGWAGEVEWLEIDTPSTESESVELNGNTAHFAESLNIRRVIVSVSTTREMAIAMVIAERSNSEAD